MELLFKRTLVGIHLNSASYKLAEGSLIRENKKIRYEVKEPALNKESMNAYLDSFYYVKNKLSEKDIKKNLGDSYFTILSLMRKAIKSKGHALSSAEEMKIVYYLYRDIIGLGLIESLYSEPELSFISCEGLGKPVYVYFKEHGFVNTNIKFKSRNKLGSMVWRLLKKSIKTSNDGLKGILPDKSFFETDYEFGFKIRKAKPRLNPEFLIKNKIATPGALAFLDSVLKHKKNILIVGAKDSGKTMFISGLLDMMDKDYSVCLTEKEPHFAVDSTKWSTAVTKVQSKKPEDILEEHVRKNPDYIVIDEINEKSAGFVLDSLASVPGIVSIEAGNTDVAMTRITSRYKVPKSFLANIDVIVMLSPSRDIEEIIEIHRYDKEKNEIVAKVVFRKERGKLIPYKSRFMRSLDSIHIEQMKKKAKELNSFSKK